MSACGLCNFKKVSELLGHLSRMMSSSTLVETVSISYEDFNESFLTCGSCLYTYDGQEHTPKLLPCSHTVCRSCLERIVSGIGIRDAGSFRCPVCREIAPLPRGGVPALPPSFLVNQLLDLMATQRREVVPKCSTHISQELLFCETCDSVFCSLCTTGIHGGEDSTSEHIVIPFSIAVKRLSEILLYKANLCINKLNMSSEAVSKEIVKLDQSVEQTSDLITSSFQNIVTLIEKRQQRILEKAKKTKNEKKKVLQDQLTVINNEKENIEDVCYGLEYQIEVDNITKKISDLGEKYDTMNSLMVPLENSYIEYKYEHNSSLLNIQNSLNAFGRIYSSKTFPSLCTATLNISPAHLQSVAYVSTVDYHGQPQTSGADPVHAELEHECKDKINLPVNDNKDGTYEIRFTPEYAGIYRLHITMFGRPIKHSPFEFTASEHIDPIACFGSRGSGDCNFLQPVGVTTHPSGKVFVLDTGNCRIKVLTSDLEFIQHIKCSVLDDRGVTGLAVTSANTLLLVNWKCRNVTEIRLDGSIVRQFTHSKFIEPIDVAVNSTCEVLVADNSACSIFAFNHTGELLRTICCSKVSHSVQLTCITSVATGPEDAILVAGSSIQVFTSRGDFQRVVHSEGKGRGIFGGLTYDGRNCIFATRSDKTGSCVQVFSFDSGQFLFNIDSFGAKLKRPSGIIATNDCKILVVDLGNDCIKKYRYQ